MAIKGWKQVLGRLLRRRAQERERIRSAVWREITRREWANHRYDQRQDNGNAYEHGWFERMMAELAGDTAGALAAGVRHHGMLAWMVRARRRQG